MTTTPSLSFLPIDFERHHDICVNFRRDSYVCSFGSDASFIERHGADGSGYLIWLRDRSSELPAGCVHVWHGNDIVGQMEMRQRPELDLGYINLFYLIPPMRGRRVGDQLHDYALGLFRSLQVAKLRLSVSPTNSSALHFYLRHGWQDLGPRSDHPEVHTMELQLRR